jgi:aspartate/methionine/tyrosine aminotransferase
VDIAREHGIILHSDEVYRPLFHSLDADSQDPPSVLSLGYEKTIVTGSMSKAFSLAGIRLGWIASLSPEIFEACASTRDYTVISVSQVDDQIATFALDSPTVHNLLSRNIDLARRNLAAVDDFVKDFKWACRWTRPQAGTTAFIRFSDKGGSPVDDVEVCKRLQQKTGVMFVPGSQCFGGGVDFKGFVRVGYVNEHQVITDGLKALRVFMGTEYAEVPLA